MKSHPGVAAKTFEVLGALGIEPEVVSTSPIKIACHIAMEDVERAVLALHFAARQARAEQLGAFQALGQDQDGFAGVVGQFEQGCGDHAPWAADFAPAVCRAVAHRTR